LNARPVVSIFYRKSLDDIIYKQLELVVIMVIRPVKDYGELVKVALKKKKGVWEKVWVCRLRVLEITGFCGSCACCSVVVVEGFVSGIEGAWRCMQLVE
jgi:hypothetical protein